MKGSLTASITAIFCLFVSEQIFSSICRKQTGEKKKSGGKNIPLTEASKTHLARTGLHY